MLEQVASLLILSATLKTFDTISSRFSTLKGPLSSYAYVCTTLSSRITHTQDGPEVESVVNDPRLTPPFLSVVIEEVGDVRLRSHLKSVRLKDALISGLCLMLMVMLGN